MRSLLISIGAVALGLALIAGMSSPSAASAAEIGGNWYTGEGSEQNDVTVSYDASTGTYTLTDAGVVTISNPVGACSVVGNVATCPPPFSPAFVELGEGDDFYTVLGAAPDDLLTVEGEGGSDTIDLSRVVTTTHNGFLRGDDSMPSISDGDDVIRAGDGSGGRGYLMVGGGGSDQLYGGSGDDGLLDYYAELGPTPGTYVIDTVGEPDLLDGGGGDDQLDAGNGADIMRGGPGSDLLGIGMGWRTLIEPGRYLVSIDDGFVDSLSCGPGADGQAVVGPRDTVTADCEVITQSTTCPEGAPGPCLNTLIVSAPAPAGSSASTAAKSRRRVRLTKPRTIQVAAGRTKAVTLRTLKRGKRRALKGRKKVRARVAARRRLRNRPRKRLRSERTPFVLKRR